MWHAVFGCEEGNGVAKLWGSGRNRAAYRAMLVFVLLGSLARGALAQEGVGQAAPAHGSEATGSISGDVKDVGGTAVDAAQVALWTEADRKQRLAETDSGGHFGFSGVPVGRFTLTISETGLETLRIAGVLHLGELYQAPPIVLRIATATASIEVTLPPDELAVQQVRQEETQRVLGVVPNFFVTYQEHPAPLRARQKFSLALHGVADPTASLGSAIVAGIQQANNSLPGYGSDAPAYGERFGAAYANGASSTMLRGAVFPSLFHQDPRFYYKAEGSVWAKTKYALSTAVICHGDNGRWQPNYSGILGNLSAGALTNLYYPPGSRNGAGVTLENGLLVTAGVGIGHVLQEFLYNRLTTHRH
jgi:hypothetical protein